MAARSAGDAIADHGAGGPPDPGRFARAAGRSHGPRRSPTRDSLARPADPGPAGSRQRLLHGLSFSCAANFRPPLVAVWPRLAARAAKQVAGSASAGALSVGLRGI